MIERRVSVLECASPLALFPRMAAPPVATTATAGASRHGPRIPAAKRLNVNSRGCNPRLGAMGTYDPCRVECVLLFPRGLSPTAIHVSSLRDNRGSVKMRPAPATIIFAARQGWGHGVDTSSWCLLFRSLLVVRGASPTTCGSAPLTRSNPRLLRRADTASAPTKSHTD